MIEENNEEEDEEEDEGGFLLSFNETGKGVILTPKKDYEKIIENQQKIIMEFLQENNELFNKFLEKKGITEEEFNKGEEK